ncbi:MAG: aminoacetone oxidase family FAD-binding enzyme [Halobacteriovorax sp.]|nr:aminoacetone oxidase family FAD-binding enzyme [Halobacteriovorax sp.]|tara:strand:- start:218374 stop:219504 length:1131 start_codon:yes stop_codon:yes gene_type:complete
MNYDVVVLGAGAAGLMAAATAGKRGKKVLLLEHNKSAGKKILISGGGRANFTNLKVTPNDYICSQRNFHKYALKEYREKDFIELVKSYHIKFFEKKLGQLFCEVSAKELLSMLLKECEKAGVEIVYGASGIEVSEQYKIRWKENSVDTEKLIIATGGLSVPTIGATDFGQTLAKKYGHKIIPMRPALVGLKVNGTSELSGLSQVAEVKVGKFKIIEDVLLTHKGLSGPAILKSSLHWEKGEELKINWLPDENLDELLTQSKKTISQVLHSKLPNRLLDFLVPENKKPLNEMPKKEINKAKERLRNFEVLPTGTEGYRKAEVTAGGVDTSDINQKTMESTISPGLYFIGEVLDVTGQLGGYNFQWAWSSGVIAGRSV